MDRQGWQASGQKKYCTDLSPTHGTTRLAVLHQEMGSTNLARLAARTVCAVGWAVVLGHVKLELLRVGAGGRLPAAVLLGGIEVVREVLAVAVSYFPVRWESGFSL